MDHMEAMLGDIMVHLHDLMVEFDATKGSKSWLRRRLLPMFEAFGRSYGQGLPQLPLSGALQGRLQELHLGEPGEGGEL
jgi:hypothetical protein